MPVTVLRARRVVTPDGVRPAAVVVRAARRSGPGHTSCIVSLQLSLPVLWTHARARGFGLEDVARWMAAEPAALVGLDRPGAGKGTIAVGNDADPNTPRGALLTPLDRMFDREAVR